jgi:hypothetical protein
VNGDGKPDLLVSNQGQSGTASTVSLLLGQGGAAFGSVMTSPVLIQPRGVALADFDGDSKLDAAVANSGSNAVAILLGSGTGGFTAKSQANTSIGANAVAVGDWNGDGHLDLAVANSGTVAAGGSVSVLLGNGDGTFKLQATLQAGAAANSVAARDVNGDKNIDLVVGSSAGIDVYISSGSGAFASAVRFLNGTAVSSVGVADFDGTGNLDLYALSGNNVSVLFNAGGTGTGLFGPAKSVGTTGNAPAAALALDLDANGADDLVTANATSNDISVLLNYGTGSFAPAKLYPLGGANTGPRGLGVTDLNNDGTPDPVTVNAGSGNVSVLLSQCL